MAETLSPNPTMGGQKQRLPMAARIQSPTSPFFLGSNDDQLERAQARAARAAAIRRKNAAVNLHSQSSDANSDPCLNKQQILDLFHNCIKLASENVKKRKKMKKNLLLLLKWIVFEIFVNKFIIIIIIIIVIIIFKKLFLGAEN